jgi:xylan 1,4-beta-xylosidase
VQRWRTGYHHNDAYDAWIELGSPAQLTRTQENTLRQASQGAPEASEPVQIGAAGEFDETVPMDENGVVLLKLTPN